MKILNATSEAAVEKRKEKWMNADLKDMVNSAKGENLETGSFNHKKAGERKC